MGLEFTSRSGQRLMGEAGVEYLANIGAGYQVCRTPALPMFRSWWAGSGKCRQPSLRHQLAFPGRMYSTRKVSSSPLVSSVSSAPAISERRTRTAPSLLSDFLQISQDSTSQNVATIYCIIFTVSVETMASHASLSTQLVRFSLQDLVK